MPVLRAIGSEYPRRLLVGVRIRLLRLNGSSDRLIICYIHRLLFLKLPPPGETRDL